MTADLLTHLTAVADSRTFAYKWAWMQQVKDLASRFSVGLGGANILEIGAGVHNPAGSSLVARALGASVARAIEPSPPVAEHLQDALQVALLASAETDIFQKHTDEDYKALRQALVLGEDTFTTTILVESPEELGDQSFDIFHSNAVLEHVQDVTGLLTACLERSSPGALHIHKVDFIDHDYYSRIEPDAADPFNFLFEDAKQNDATQNKIRHDEMLEIFAQAGLEHVATPQRWSLPFETEFRERLEPRFRTCTDACLSTVGAIFVHRA